MEENHTKDRVSTKNVSGLQAAEKLGGSDTDDHSVSKSTQKSVSEKGSELETESKEPNDVQSMDTETQNRLKAFLEVAGVKLSHVDARTFQDPEILRKLTNRWSCCLVLTICLCGRDRLLYEEECVLVGFVSPIHNLYYFFVRVFKSIFRDISS